MAIVKCDSTSMSSMDSAFLSIGYETEYN